MQHAFASRTNYLLTISSRTFSFRVDPMPHPVRDNFSLNRSASWAERGRKAGTRRHLRGQHLRVAHRPRRAPASPLALLISLQKLLRRKPPYFSCGLAIVAGCPGWKKTKNGERSAV